jgi:hypothetical protein
MNTGHGSPYDRGLADYYYRRPMDPHYYPNGTGYEPRIDPSHGMTDEEVREYLAGYADGEMYGDQKDYGSYDPEPEDEEEE